MLVYSSIHEAEEHYRELFSIHPLVFLLRLGDVLVEKAEIYHSIGETQKALDITTELVNIVSETIVRKESRSEYLFRVLLLQEYLYQRSGRYEESMRAARQAIVVLDTLTNEDTDVFFEMSASAQWRLGKSLSVIGKTEESIEIAKVATSKFCSLVHKDPNKYGGRLVVCLMGINENLIKSNRETEVITLTYEILVTLKNGFAENPQQYKKFFLTILKMHIAACKKTGTKLEETFIKPLTIMVTKK